MIKIFIPQEKSKNNKAQVRGFWKNPKGKIYYDYIFIENKDFTCDYVKNHELKSLQKVYNQEAIFYIEDDQAFIFNGSKHIQKLTHRIVSIVQRDKNSLKGSIKKFLELYGGVTVYIDNLCYTLEAWTV